MNKFLAPAAFIYGIITLFRNALYDLRIIKTYNIPIKSICVGNLSVGGTGKSPMVAYLIDHFKNKKKLHILSRGYGRETKGYVLADERASHLTIGDEPFMYYKRFSPQIKVSVSEQRKEGIEKILLNENPDLLILDDAFQHRKVKAGFNIVLSDFSKPFYKDYLLPVGRLRESRDGIKRADLLIYSKCPENLTEKDKLKAIKKSKLSSEKVYFSKVKYGELKSFSTKIPPKLEQVLLVTGIANPSPLIDFLKQNYQVECLQFSDHHNFSIADIVKIHKKFDTFVTDNKAIVTTEKDYVRLLTPEFSDLLSQKPWLYQQMTIEIDRTKEFLEIIEEYVRTI